MKPIEFRHDQICNDKAEVSIIEERQRLSTISRGHNFMPLGSQEDSKKIANYGVVFNNKNHRLKKLRAHVGLWNLRAASVH